MGQEEEAADTARRRKGEEPQRQDFTMLETYLQVKDEPTLYKKKRLILPRLKKNLLKNVDCV
jgi:hypothetical protein